MRPLPLALAAALFAGPALAAGDGGEAPPQPTGTSTRCGDGMIYDESTRTCIKSLAEIINDDIRYVDVPELTYRGRYISALMVLDSAKNQDDSRMLNYRGFVHRKLGDVDAAMAFYHRALQADPDYVLARSYMGQGLIAQGDLAGALAQLHEIDARGGRDSWAYASLDQALRGLPTDY